MDYFVNLAGLKVRAYDLLAEYVFPASPAGRFTLMTTGTYFQTYKFQALPDPSDHPAFRIEPTARQPPSLRAGHFSREHLSQDRGLTRERKV